ncbi:hypothetical protein [Lysobacter antibioticus]|uniref:hypothetical protein n=1 Tax=Lysobacter antibioticus TaxID=84531 RepID=UPI000A8B319A|nr:hypothetical protein [Lysobacter antibioticus]
MHRAKRFALLFALFAIVSTSMGCANLGAVRSFAATSSQLTGYREVTERYVGSADRQLANLPASKLYDPARKELQALKQSSEQQKDSLLKLHDTATGYMSALAELAGEDAYNLNADIDKVSGAITAAPELGIGAEDVAAYGKIAKLVSSWALAAKQARDVKAMLKTYGDDMDRLLGAMQRAARSYEGVLQQEKASADSIQMLRLTVWKQPKSGDGLLDEARRDAIVAMSNNSYAGIAEQQAKALQAAAAASQGLAQVRSGHAAMLKDADRLKSKQLQALLKQAVADMKTVRAQLDAL